MSNRLMDFRSNISYVKTEEGEFIPVYELIFLCDKPDYQYTNEREIVRNRGVEELRCVTSKAVLLQLSKTFLELAEKEGEALKSE